MRLVRRLGGSLLILAVAGLIWTGPLPRGHVAPEQATEMLKHWVAVFGLVGLLVVFSVWDAVEGVRHLRGYLDTLQEDELGKIRDHLGQNPEAKSVLKDLE